MHKNYIIGLKIYNGKMPRNNLGKLEIVKTPDNDLERRKMKYIR